MEKQKNLYYIYKKNELFAEKIEQKIILYNNNITIPALVIEHNISNNLSYYLEDLKQFYTKFGEVLNIIIKGNINIVLFKSFLAANICKVFLEQKDNYKINMGRVRWFNLNKDHNLLNKELYDLFVNISNKNIFQIKYNNNINNISNTNNYINNNTYMNNNINNINNFNINNNIPDYNIINNIQNQNNLNNIIMNNNNINNNIINNNNINTNNAFNNINIGMMNNINSINSINNFNNINNINNLNNINVINNINNINNLNINNNDQYRMYNSNNYSQNNNINNIKNLNINEDKVSVKYTCKYEILIENDSEFQIARKLIGSKGINMKRIINKSKLDKDKETVKLRLRGKGSGYKEGPHNKESDDPLHLCISAKTKEEMNKACFLVNKLLEKIGEEYKIFCEKKGKKINVDNIARKIENTNINYKFN